MSQSDGDTPLLRAVLNKKLRDVELLVAAKANCSAKRKVSEGISRPPPPSGEGIG